MKKKFITALMLSGLFLGSCNSALDLNPLDQIASDNYFSKKSDFDNALAGVYASLQSEAFSYGMPFRDCLTDNGYNQFNSGSVNEIVGGNLNPTTGGYETGIYNDAYVGIGRANRLIEKLQGYNGSDMNDGEKKNMEAEARFIRAFV
ncbi:MAG: RagB/SusD family nutrient uptake outer membrane protein, partial [Sphingobacterium sp.]